MQIILLLMLVSSAFAQKSMPGNQCDPVVAERECYNLLCSNNPKKTIPSDADELTKAFEAHPYELPPKLTADIDKIASVSESIKEAARKTIDNNELGKMADELTDSPVETSFLINELYKGELNCLQQNRKCIVVSSDMKPHSEEMKNYFRILNDKTYLFREGITMPMDDKKDYLNDMLSEMAGLMTPDQMKAEKKKIKKLKRDVDYMIYAMDAPWLNDYKKKVSNELKPYKAAVAASLKTKMTELMQIDLSSDQAKLKVKKSCQLASYVKTTLDRNTTHEDFAKKKVEIINSFKTKFLPKLSQDSARELSQRLKPEGLFLIHEDGNYHPFPPALGQHSNGYEEPKNNYQVLRDLSLLTRGHEFRCQVKGMLIKDHYNFGNDSINISQYSLANSFNDAITHEIGHWLSARMKHKDMSGHSRKKLYDVRDCVTDFYPNDKDKSAFSLFKHGGDRSRTEEDFADWFTAKAGLGESGLFCDLKKMLNNFVETSKESSYLPHKGDSHSNLLFREINLRMNRGETIPQSCKDLVDYYPESKPQKCDW